MSHVCVTGATGFVGAHVARLLAERGDEVRVTFRDPARLERLWGVDFEPVKADVLDRAALRRAFKDCETVYHAAGLVASRPVKKVWEVNALAPRLAVEAAAAEGVERLVLTSSVAGVGPAPPASEVDEEVTFTAGGLGLTYSDTKHEGEIEALAAAARTGVEVVVVSPGYVLGTPVDRSMPGETSNRAVGNYLRGRLPAVVDGGLSVVDVEDVARGHLLAAERGTPGERYILGGHNLGWPELIAQVAEMSGIHHPVFVIPRELAYGVRDVRALGLPMWLPIDPAGFVLMAQWWTVSSAKAKRELGYRVRPLEKTLRETIDWYLELIEDGVFADDTASPLSVGADAMRLAESVGLVRMLEVAQRWTGRRLVTGT